MDQGMIKDVVCGMRMTATEAVHASEHAGVLYRFCSEACKAKFDRDPGKFAGKPGY